MNANQITTVIVAQDLFEEIQHLFRVPAEDRKARWPAIYDRLRSTPPPLPGEPSAIIVLVQVNHEPAR